LHSFCGADTEDDEDEHEHGNARNVGVYRFPPVRLQVAEQYGEGTVLSIDPGNTEQASTRTGGNSETPQRINGNLIPYQASSRAQWRHEVGVNELNSKVAEDRQNHALDQPGGALHGGGFFMSIKVATAAAGALAFRARGFQVPQAPLVANQSKVKLALIGDGSRMSGIKSTKSSVPWAEVRRRFAQRARNEGFMVLLNNEHCTSIKSACCGVRNKKACKNKDINYSLVRKDGCSYRPVQYSLLICLRCGKSLHWNGAATTNKAHVGHLHAQRLGMAAMAPPRLRLSNNTHLEEDAPRAQLILDLAGACRCPTYTRAAANGPGHGPQARLASALRSDGEDKADQTTANRSGDETARLRAIAI
jgi:hypothetical protein